MEQELKNLVLSQGLEDSVFFVGSVPNDQLPTWYNAADLFFLGSSREGWPNVVCEALACGTPVVATPVHGIPEILTSEDLGMMVERTPDAFAEGIVNAFAKKWDRQHIAWIGQQRTWRNVAAEVHELFTRLKSDEKN